ncbi:MAG: hypothetical protein IID41_17240 [Planctomycetes bacterium]|nr:hypothetical protein [Planctomycetota bacterium]
MHTKHSRTKKCGRLTGMTVFAVVLLCSGCASTKMRSFADPQFKGHQYKRIVVAARLEHLDLQADAEDIFVKKFSKLDGEFIRSLDVLPPTREYDDDGLFSTLREHNVDAVLILRQTAYDEDVSTYSTSHGSLSANTYYYGPNATTYGSTSGSTTTHTIRKPRVRHQVELYDVATKKMAWIGGSLTRGNAYARFKNLMDALARETRNELLDHGFVAKPEKQ